MPTIKAEFEVYCGNGLCANTKNVIYRRGQSIEVEPCEKCIERTKDRGYEEGYEEGKRDET